MAVLEQGLADALGDAATDLAGLVLLAKVIRVRQTRASNVSIVVAPFVTICPWDRCVLYRMTRLVEMSRV